MAGQADDRGGPDDDLVDGEDRAVEVGARDERGHRPVERAAAEQHDRRQYEHSAQAHPERLGRSAAHEARRYRGMRPVRKYDEQGGGYSITWSARRSIDGGNVSPRALAVLRFSVR